MIDYPLHSKSFHTRYSHSERDIISDVMGIFLLVFSAVLFISFLTMDINDTSLLASAKNTSIKNILGPFGAYTSALSFFTFGKASYIMAMFYILMGLHFITKNEKPHLLKSILLFLLIVISSSVLFDLVLKNENSYERGGVVGEAIRNTIKIDKLSIFVFSVMWLSSLFSLVKDILPSKKFLINIKKADNILRNNSNNETIFNIKEILTKKISDVKDNYQSIPFITIKTVDENEIKNKKFLEIENMKSSIEKDIKNFESKTEKKMEEKSREDKSKIKTPNNIYKDAFKINNKTFSGDIGEALSNAIFSSTKTKTENLDNLHVKEDIREGFEKISGTHSHDNIPMTLDDIFRKNKLKQTLPKLDNIYTSSIGITNEKKSHSYPNTLEDYLNPKKIETDFEVSIVAKEGSDDENKNTRSRMDDIDELLESIEREKKSFEYEDDKNDYKEKNIHEEVMLSSTIKENEYSIPKSNIFEFEASRSADKPYKREDHFPSPKVDYVLPVKESYTNNNSYEKIEREENIYSKVANDDTYDKEYVKESSYIKEERDYNTTTEPQYKKEVYTAPLTNVASKLRINIVDSDDIDSRLVEKSTIQVEDRDFTQNETYSPDFLSKDYEDNTNSVSDYIESIESYEDKSNPADKTETHNIDYAREIELERERIKAKMRENINIELPKPKHIKKIDHNINEELIQTNYESRYIDKNYKKPPLELLERAIIIDDSNVVTAIKQTAIQLENTLLDFGIEAKVTGVSRGPVVTRYELELASGTRVSKIVSLTDNIALALASESVRIIAPIPGRSVIGIEIPNKIRASVSLREILENPDFRLSKKDIPFALGKGIYGNNVITDLAEAPHLLVAGTTGSGKSVCLSTIILSLLFRFRPDELKFIFIDKKRVELSIYNGIPHLMSPVVSDEKKATVVLRHIVDIMERRYEKMEKFFVRNVKAYNEKVNKLIKDGETSFEGESLELFPYIVVVIDELHNLMVVSSKEVEDLISRLAGMSRAVGIHLIIATQRPSADVVTGVIKANLPTRIAFQVPNKTNSRIIIDMAGAEQLLGKGDGLFCCSGSQMPERVQGAFVSDNEVKKVVDYLSQNIEPLYDEALIAALDKNEVDGKDTDEEDILDEALWQDAINVVARTRKASASFLQRRLKIGYNRAARIVEIMERQGLVGPENGSKPRDVFIDSDYE